MISNFKLIPNFNISQNFVQNVQKQKNTFVLSCSKKFLIQRFNNEFKELSNSKFLVKLELKINL